MDAAAVAEYLKQNPRFFEDYADVIAEIFVPHPHGGHAIPIAERQIVTLREKNQDLEAKLRELIAYGTENDADQREGAPLDARALRGARPRNHARGALPQPEGRLRRAAGRRAAVGQGARAVVPAASWPRRPPRCATMPTSWRSRIAGRVARVRVARMVRGRRASCSRSRSCRCAPRRRSACSRSRSPDPERFHPGHGDAVPRRGSPSSRASRPRGSCRSA